MGGRYTDRQTQADRDRQRQSERERDVDIHGEIQYNTIVERQKSQRVWHRQRQSEMDWRTTMETYTDRATQ